MSSSASRVKGVRPAKQRRDETQTPLRISTVPCGMLGLYLAVGFFSLLVLSLLLLLCYSRKLSPFPGPPDGDTRALFTLLREDAHLLLLRRFAPHRTLNLDELTSTADPALLSALLNNRANSVGRSIVYRLVAWFFPFSDGMLFVGDKDWERRHKLFTPLFQTGVVRGYTLAACQGAARVAALQVKESGAGIPVAPAPKPTLPNLAAPQGPLGGAEDPHTREDLLALLRWAAMRTFLAWAGGLDPDVEEGPHANLVRGTARTLDSYTRHCFDVLPELQRGIPRAPITGTLAWLQGYGKLREFGQQVKDCVQSLASLQPGGVPLPGSPFAPRSTQQQQGQAHTPLDTPLSRMLKEGWSVKDITCEVNHLHGAHKAIALVATAALCELSMCHPGVREALVEELVGVCGRHPGGGVGEGGDWHPPTSEDLERRLPLLSRVWKETLRRHVVSQGTMRHVREAVEESHTVLPPSKDVLILLHALHHDSELWGPDAHCWEPERWDKTSDYWVKRRAWELEQEGGGGFSSTGSGSGGGGSKFWSEGASSSPGGVFIPASHPNAYSPFLDGLRRCAGMHLAKLQFAALLYALLVPFSVKVTPPCTPTQAIALEAEENSTPSLGSPVGGGTGIVPGAVCIARTGAIACIREPALPFSTPSRFDLEVEGERRRGGGGGEGKFHYRCHIVKTADMFTTWEGVVPYTVVRG